MAQDDGAGIAIGNPGSTVQSGRSAAAFFFFCAPASPFALLFGAMCDEMCWQRQQTRLEARGERSVIVHEAKRALMQWNWRIKFVYGCRKVCLAAHPRKCAEDGGLRLKLTCWMQGGHECVTAAVCRIWRGTRRNPHNTEFIKAVTCAVQ